MNVAARRLSFTDRCDDLSSSDRSYSFVTRIRQGVCLRGGKRIQLCPVCTRRTYTILLWAWLYCGRLVRLDHLAATANCIIRVACINFDWMVTCNGFARVGLRKANAVEAKKKAKPQDSLVAFRASPHEGSALMYNMQYALCSFQDCTPLESSTRPCPRTSMNMQLNFLTYTPCFTATENR